MEMKELGDFMPGKIVGGSPAEAGRFSFQAAVLDNGSQFCGGSLIAPNVVATSAFCNFFGIPTHVALGCVDLNDLNNCEVIEISESFIFPGFNSNEFFSGDLELLVLQQHSVHTPVAIGASEFDLEVGQDLTVIGWGAVDPASLEDSDGILLETTLEATSQESCDKQYRDILGLFLNSGSEDEANQVNNSNVQPFNGTFIDDTKFCALGNDTSACSGDTGGPIFIRCDATGSEVQVGLASFTLGCAYDAIPGTYTSIFQPDLFAFMEDIVQNQGHELKIVSQTSDFCVVGGTKPTEELSDPPTPFPTFDLTKWTCSGELFADGEACDCNCGIPDPDCKFQLEDIRNCEAGEICMDAVCIRPEVGNTSSPTSAPSVSPTFQPTFLPSSSPTVGPSASPSISESETNNPTSSPTEAPTFTPTTAPSESPSAGDDSTERPSISDDSAPTLSPSKGQKKIEDFFSLEVLSVMAVVILLLIILVATIVRLRSNSKLKKKKKADYELKTEMEVVDQI